MVKTHASRAALFEKPSSIIIWREKRILGRWRDGQEQREEEGKGGRGGEWGRRRGWEVHTW